nr:MAG TPA: hypothetical protein [Caudoviricetes sp.]
MSLSLFETWLLITQSIYFQTFTLTHISSLCCSYIALRDFQQLKVFYIVYFYTNEHEIYPQLQVQMFALMSYYLLPLMQRIFVSLLTHYIN